jgi:hypothetical protein
MALPIGLMYDNLNPPQAPRRAVALPNDAVAVAQPAAALRVSQLRDLNIPRPRVHNAFMRYRRYLEDTDPDFKALPFREKATETGRRWKELKENNPALYHYFKAEAALARAEAARVVAVLGSLGLS